PAGQDHVQAEGPAGRGEEVLAPGLPGAWTGQTIGAEARRVERQRYPAVREQTPARPQPGTRRVLGQGQERAIAGHSRGAPSAELAIFERELEVGCMQRRETVRAAEHAATPVSRQLDPQPVRLEPHDTSPTRARP